MKKIYLVGIVKFEGSLSPFSLQYPSHSDCSICPKLGNIFLIGPRNLIHTMHADLSKSSPYKYYRKLCLAEETEDYALMKLAPYS